MSRRLGGGLQKGACQTKKSKGIEIDWSIFLYKISSLYFIYISRTFFLVARDWFIWAFPCFLWGTGLDVCDAFMVMIEMRAHAAKIVPS
jgi:hypothetical protein